MCSIKERENCLLLLLRLSTLFAVVLNREKKTKRDDFDVINIVSLLLLLPSQLEEMAQIKNV